MPRTLVASVLPGYYPVRMRTWKNPTLDDWREIVYLMSGEDCEILAAACAKAHVDEEVVTLDDEGTLIFDWRSDV